MNKVGLKGKQGKQGKIGRSTGEVVSTNGLRRIRGPLFIQPLHNEHKVSNEAGNQALERGGIPNQHELIVDSRLIELLNY